ncbi:MAG TPA: Calx-beta domain-containing protein [Methylomirabilota bacterium]|nr:Calx-beta domain-containing protein [Methylomirabilota bacterium]
MKKHVQLNRALIGAVLALGGFAPWAPAQTVLYSDNFDIDSSANWTVKVGSGNGTPDAAIFFAFDYSTTKFVRNGVTNTIPPAPNGGGKGVKMYVNKNDAVADIAAISIYPTSKVFSNDFAFRFDMWLNYNGGFQGGSGSTEFGTFGIDHIGDKVNWQDGVSVSDGCWFGVTGEAGAAADYRSYVGDNAGIAIRSTGSAGGFLDRDGNLVFEEEVFDEPSTYPLKLMFPPPLFETPGVPGKQWVQMEIRQRTNSSGGHVVTWLMNNYVIAEHSAGDLVGMTNGTVMLGNMDIFASIANPAADNYVIYDNVRVVDLSNVAPLPIVTVVTNDDTATESPPGDTGSFTITRTGDTTNPLTVNYRMSGSASNNVDYVNLPGSVVIAAGQSSTNLIVTPINDSQGEGTETVVLTLVGSANYDLYTNISAIVNLVDDGDLPVATITAFRRAAYEANTNQVGQFRIDFTSPFFSDVAINFVMSGTAVNGVNYTTLTSPITMPAGSTNVLVNIVPIDDSSTVSNRTVILTLASGGYVIGAVSNATVTIFNDDLAPATATLFSDNFETDTSPNWNVNASAAVCDAAFGFDYSTVGIPPAPHSAGGTTFGLRFRANSPSLGGATASGISASPKNQNFTNDYRIRVDWWPNVPGPLPVGGAGSTQLGTFGITRGTIPQWNSAPATTDAVFLGMTGDGGTAPDVRVYTTNGAAGVAAVSTGVYAAGTGATAFNEEDPYYAVFGRQAPPDAQAAVNSAQTGPTALGAPGEAWHEVVVTKRGNSVSWSVDGLRIATLNAESFGVTLSTNVFIGQSEINSGQTSAALDNMQFGLFDNFRVESLALPTVTITSVQVVGSNVVISFTGGADDPTVAYKLVESSTITGTFAINGSAVITSSAPGSFTATAALNGPLRFYRIRR